MQTIWGKRWSLLWQMLPGHGKRPQKTAGTLGCPLWGKELDISSGSNEGVKAGSYHILLTEYNTEVRRTKQNSWMDFCFDNSRARVCQALQSTDQGTHLFNWPYQEIKLSILFSRLDHLRASRAHISSVVQTWTRMSLWHWLGWPAQGSRCD